MRRITRTFTAALAAAAALAALSACATPTETPNTTTSTKPSDSASAPSKPGTPDSTKPGETAKDGTALAALNTLPVKGKAPKTGYDRSQFGTEWDDAVGKFPWSRNGCDTRNDVLARDLQREVVENNGCVVTSGTLAHEPYTGEANRLFVAGGSYDESFDVEHVVALGNVWVTGGQQLSPEKRAEIANDPINLYLADPSQNRSKGDADFATWLPPNKAFRCSYAARQIRVKTVYGLWVTKAEKAALAQVLAKCPNEPLVQPDPQDGYTASETNTPVEAPSAPEPSESADPEPSAVPTASGGSDVEYANCAEARAAGAAPLYKGDPGYAAHLDGDGDGDACE